MSMVQILANVFNVKKCKVLHIGHNNAHRDYSMHCEGLQYVMEEADLGVIGSMTALKDHVNIDVLIYLRQTILSSTYFGKKISSTFWMNSSFLHGWASAELPRNRVNVNLFLRHIRELSR